MIKLTLLTSAIIIAGLTANTVNAAYTMTDQERESQLAHAFIEGNPTTKVQKQIAALTNGKEITGTIYKSDGSVDVKRTAQMLVKTNGKDPLVEAEKRAAAQAAAEEARLNLIQDLRATIAQLNNELNDYHSELTVVDGNINTLKQTILGITDNAERTTQNNLLDAEEDAKEVLIESIRTNGVDFNNAYESLRDTGYFYQSLT